MTSFSSSFKKFTACNSSPSALTYPQLPDSIIYLRIFLGIAYGTSLGYRENSTSVALTGAVGIVFGINVVVFIPILYLQFYLNAKIDSYKKSLNFVGVVNGLAAMLLVWVTLFTALHEMELEALGGAVVKSAVDVVTKGGEEGNFEVVEDLPETEF